MEPTLPRADVRVQQEKYGQSLHRGWLTLSPPYTVLSPTLPVHHQLPEFTQTHVHWAGDVIQPAHPLLSLLLPPSIFPTIRIFSNESALRIRWPKYWSFSFSISPSNEYSRLISFIYETIIEAESSRQYNVSTVGGSNIKSQIYAILNSKQILMLGLVFFFL